MTDWIGLVESAYSLEGDLDVWLGRVLEAAESVLDQGGGLAGWIYSHAGDDWRIVTAGGRSSDPAFTELTQQTLAKTDLMNLHRLLLGSAAGGTLSSVRRSERPVERETLTTLSRNRFQDAFGLIAPTATGQGLVIGGPLPRRQKTSIADFNRHRRVAAHLGAGLRLRLALENSAGGGVEAVLDPNARLHDATGPAWGSRAREFLRAAVEGRERARTRDQREDPDQALTIWEGLVAGRWSLVDRFESDGKRYVVARANDPELGDPPGRHVTLDDLQRSFGTPPH